METDFEFNLGALVRDVITGFEGVVICRSQLLNSCNVYAVQPMELKGGEPQQRHHFDEPQLRLIKDKQFAELKK